MKEEEGHPYTVSIKINHAQYTPLGFLKMMYITFKEIIQSVFIELKSLLILIQFSHSKLIVNLEIKIQEALILNLKIFIIQ